MNPSVKQKRSWISWTRYAAREITTISCRLMIDTSENGELESKHFVMIVGIVTVTIIVFFSFVFRRVAKVRMEITKTKVQLEMGCGEKG